jgi:toxin CptA
VWAAGAAAVSAWAYFSSVNDWRVLFAVLASALAGCVAAGGWYAAPVGNLAWDGQVWRWQSEAYSTGESTLELVAVLDFQRVLWLRLENSAGASLWLWAEKSALPHRWMDLRRAAVSSVGVGSGGPAAPLAPSL